MFEEIITKQLVLFAFIAKSTWFGRNPLIYDMKFQHHASLYKHAIQECNEHIKAVMSLKKPSYPKQTQLVYWEAPPIDWVKAN